MKKPMIGYEDFYEVDSHGFIVSKRFKKPLKHFLSNKGYAYVDLFDGNNRKREAVHRLVAKHFVEGHTEGKEVNHIDEVRDNNDYRNLEWVTKSENLLHSRARKVAKLDLKTSEVLKVYDSIVATKEDGFKPTEVVHVCKGRNNYHYGFKWKYVD